MRISVVPNPLHCFRIDIAKYALVCVNVCVSESTANESTRDTTKLVRRRKRGNVTVILQQREIHLVKLQKKN